MVSTFALFGTPRKALWWFFGVAVIVRLTLLALTHHDYMLSGMAQGELARNIAEGRGFVVNGPWFQAMNSAQWEEFRLIDPEEWIHHSPPDDRPEHLRPFIAYMMPGQGILLAATFRIFGAYRYIYLQIIQAFVDSLGVFLIYALAAHFFSPTVGLLTALLFALYIPEARLAVSATRDAWMPFAYLAGSTGILLGWKKQKSWYLLFGGCAIAFGAYFRSEILLLPMFFAFLFLFQRPKFMPLWRVAVLGILPSIVLLTPWTIRNYQVFDRFIATNSGLWLAAWQSFGEYDNPVGAVNNDLVTLRQMRDLGHKEEYDTPEYDDLFRPLVLDAIRNHPGWWMSIILRRIVSVPFQMHQWGIPVTDDWRYGIEVFRQQTQDVSYWAYFVSDPLRFVVQAFAKTVNAFLFLALFATWFVVETPRRFVLLLLAAAPLYNIAIHALIGMQARYILPTNPFLLPFVAFVLLVIARWYRSGRELRLRPSGSERSGNNDNHALF